MFPKKKYIYTLCCLYGLFSGITTQAEPIAPPADQHQSTTQPTTPAAKPNKDSIEIPALIDRPFSIDDGPYIIVKAFRLKGVKPTSTPSIVLSEIEALLDDQLQQQPAHGFSIGRLQEIASLVANYYRKKGFILSDAILPVQDIIDGAVDIQVLVGRLGRVLIEGNKKYSEDILLKPFARLIDKPIRKKEIEAALLTLTEFPGLSIFGVFQPGLQVGKADIVLKVQQEKNYSVALRGDNHGLTSVGLNRVRANIVWNNPTGGADKINFLVQQSYNPKNTKFFGSIYERYLGNGFTAGINLFRNRFTTNLNNAQTSVETFEGGLFLEKSWIKSREQNLSTKLTFSRSGSNTFYKEVALNRDALSVLAIETAYDFVDTINPLQYLYEHSAGGGLNLATIELRHGFNDLFGAIGAERAALPPQRQGGPPDRRYATGQFNSLFASYSRLQILSANQSLLLKAELQYSRDLLLPAEQYSIGGPNNVRALLSSTASFDNAYLVSVDYRINAPFIADIPAFANKSWGEIVQLFTFYDFASGRRNDPLYNDDPKEQGGWVKFSGYGFGLLFNITGSISSQLIWAKQLKNEDSESMSDRARKSRIWFDFTYGF